MKPLAHKDALNSLDRGLLQTCQIQMSFHSRGINENVHTTDRCFSVLSIRLSLLTYSITEGKTWLKWANSLNKGYKWALFTTHVNVIYKYSDCFFFLTWTPLPSSACGEIPAYPVWGSIAVWAVFQSAVCTALGGKTPVTPRRPEDLAGPDHAECPVNVLVNKRGRKKQSL